MPRGKSLSIRLRTWWTWRSYQMSSLWNSLCCSYKIVPLYWRPPTANAAGEEDWRTVSPKALFSPQWFSTPPICQSVSAHNTPMQMTQLLDLLTNLSTWSRLPLRRTSHHWASIPTQIWHLQLSLPKTVCSVFHLANRCANTTLNINLHGTNLRHDPNPKYLGVILDRSLTFNPHTKQVAAKTAARVNLLKRLAGTGWGANFTTLRTSTLALTYSTAEYAAPAWSHSTNTAAIDVVLNTAMRLISGALPSTPVGCLPILSGIPPAELRRNLLTLKLACMGTSESKSLIPPPAVYAIQRLKRRHFSTEIGRLLTMSPLHPGWILDSWDKHWGSSYTLHHISLLGLTYRGMPGSTSTDYAMELPRPNPTFTWLESQPQIFVNAGNHRLPNISLMNA